MSQNLFIGSLAYATTDDSLKALFETVGEVTSARVVTDRETGRSRGFGFVEMANDEEGQKAIDSLNESEFEGRTINVNVACPKEERRPNNYGNRGGGFRNNGGGFNRRRDY